MDAPQVTNLLFCRVCQQELAADGEGGWTCPRRFDHPGAMDWQAERNHPAAVELGRLGGQAKSEAKTLAARENAKKGKGKSGRPKGAKDKQPRKKRQPKEAS